MSNRTAFLFPGQGSQYVGMGKDLCEKFSSAKEIFEQVDEVCRRSVSALCFEGPMEELTLTENLQPAITAVSLACLVALHESGYKAAVSAGHSLGEYPALVSAGVISAYDALRLVQKRGELMHRESLSHPGDMVAVIGMDVNALKEVINEVRQGAVLSIANHNAKEQIVITGEKEPVARAAELVKQRTGRAISLKVSGAWHSELMKGAVDEFRQFMEDIQFSEPKSVVLFNATAGTETKPDQIKDLMANQLVRPVKWYGIMRNMLKAGVTTFVEVGPKNVLTGLLKKTVPEPGKVKIHNVEDSPSLKKFLAGA